jgi:hypothetical protein
MSDRKPNCFAYLAQVDAGLAGQCRKPQDHAPMGGGVTGRSTGLHHSEGRGWDRRKHNGRRQFQTGRAVHGGSHVTPLDQRIAASIFDK